MARGSIVLLAAAAAPATVSAMRFEFPVQTPSLGGQPLLAAPIPTAAPIAMGELRRRGADEVTVFFAPDNTCGFISGSSANAITCNDIGLSCALAQTAAVGGVVGCCDTATCLGLQTTCYGLAEVTSGICNSACQSDTAVILCDATASPYCVTGSFFNGIIDYFCGTAPGSIPVATTFSGETGTRQLISVTTNLNDAFSSFSSTESSTSTGSSTSTSTTSSTSTSATGGGGGGGGGAPVGAIVGGVVGGLAVIGIVAGLIVFMMIRSRRKNAGTGPPPGQQPPPGGPSPMQQQQQPVYGATPPPGGYMGYPPPQQQQGDYRPQSYYPSPSPGPVSPSATSGHMSMVPGAVGAVGATPPPGQHQQYPGAGAPAGGPGYLYEAPNELSQKSGYQGVYEMPGSEQQPSQGLHPGQGGGSPPVAYEAPGSQPEGPQQPAHSPHLEPQQPPHQGPYQ